MKDITLIWDNWLDAFRALPDNCVDLILTKRELPWESYPVLFSEVCDELKRVTKDDGWCVFMPSGKTSESSCEDIIKTRTNEGDTVLDLFMDCLDVGIATMNLKRKFIGVNCNHGRIRCLYRLLKEHRHDLKKATDSSGISDVKASVLFDFDLYNEGGFYEE